MNSEFGVIVTLKGFKKVLNPMFKETLVEALKCKKNSLYNYNILKAVLKDLHMRMDAKILGRAQAID